MADIVRSFDGWMASMTAGDVVTLLLLLVLGLPVVALAHELGHALVLLMFTGRQQAVLIRIGGWPPRWKLHHGRLFYAVDRAYSLRGGWRALTVFHGRVGRIPSALFLLAGPLVHLPLGLAVLSLGTGTGQPVLRWYGGLIAAEGIANLIPLRFADRGTDGWRLVHALRTGGTQGVAPKLRQTVP